MNEKANPSLRRKVVCLTLMVGGIVALLVAGLRTGKLIIHHHEGEMLLQPKQHQQQKQHANNIRGSHTKKKELFVKEATGTSRILQTDPEPPTFFASFLAFFRQLFGLPPVAPTDPPTPSPIAEPLGPTAFPTASPTTSPTAFPTASPTTSPTDFPTKSPTEPGSTSAPTLELCGKTAQEIVNAECPDTGFSTGSLFQGYPGCVCLGETAVDTLDDCPDFKLDLNDLTQNQAAVVTQCCNLAATFNRGDCGPYVIPRVD